MGWTFKPSPALLSYFLAHISLPWIIRTIRSTWVSFLVSDTDNRVTNIEFQVRDADVSVCTIKDSAREKLTSTEQENSVIRDKIDDNSTTEPLNDECSACMNTVSHIDRHIIIFDTSEWPSKIEKEIGTFSNLLYNAVKQAKEDAQSTLEIKVTACHQSNEFPDLVEVLVYPENKKYFISRSNEEQIQAFARFMVMSPQDSTLYPEIQSTTIPWKKLILVCIHGARDKRCGRAGPLVINKLQAELSRRCISENDIAVRGSSHIGGHKYAGTLIVYPSGHWYGYITPKIIPTLMNCIEKDEILPRCFRGYSNSHQNISW